MLNRKKKASLLAVGCVVTLMSMLAVYANKMQKAAAPTAKEQVKDVQIPKTEKQKKFSRLLNQPSGRKLRDLAANGTGDVSIIINEPLVISVPGQDPQPLPFMQSKVCNAEAIVVGTLNDDYPQLTEDGSFLFTEYTLTVEEVIKNNRYLPIQSNSSITIVRGGGIGKINGRTIRASVEGFKPFSVGKRYILFLRYIPDTDSYLAIANGSFEINGEQLIPLGKMPDSESKDTTTFLTSARSAVMTSACTNQQPGIKK